MIDLPIPAPADPTHQRRKPDTEIFRDFALRPPARFRQTNSFRLKLFRKTSLLRHADQPDRLPLA
jgi:hypothetical protein